MHIAEVETFVVGNPPPGWGGKYFVFVQLTTDDGITGVGEAYAATFHPSVVEVMLTDVADRLLVGRSPFDIESFWRRAYGRGFTLRPDVSLQGVMSALETACWDIVGKATGQPVWNLLGGRVHETLRTYTYLYPEPGDATSVYDDADMAAQRARQEVDRGFTAVKFDPAGPYTVMGGHQPSQARLDLSVEFCAAIREAVGSEADLLFGTHGQFTSSGARRLAARLEPFDPLWFEEPVPPDNVAELAEVARSTTIPIATGERLTTKSEFARVLEAKAASIVQLNVSRAGGILEGKKISAIAEAHGAQIAPHLYNGPIGAAANVAVATCAPNFLILESIRDINGFHAELLESSIEWHDGHVVPSTEPGLGVTLHTDVARANPYRGDGLHLSMWDDPIEVADSPAGGRD